MWLWPGAERLSRIRMDSEPRLPQPRSQLLCLWEAATLAAASLSKPAVAPAVVVAAASSLP